MGGEGERGGLCRLHPTDGPCGRSLAAREERDEPPGAAERWAEWNGSFLGLGVGGRGGPAWYPEEKVGTTGKGPQSF